jgi:hypothetical protein
LFEPIKSSGLGSHTACEWCKKTLTHEEARVGRRVCQKCVRMLQDAGISEEEIFDSAESKSGMKNSASAKCTG